MSEAVDARAAHRLFDLVVDLPPAQRSAVLAQECADQPELLELVLRLLQQDAAEVDPGATGEVLAQVRIALAAAMPNALLPGTRFGAFELVEEIGAGGMGRVFGAVREVGTLRQEVAIKFLRSEGLHPALLKRFSAERQMLAALQHPGICRFLDAGTLADGSPFVVMERVHGTAMLDYCDQHKLDLHSRLRLFRKVLAAVAHAHRALIVHRDLKSSNILVSADGEPHLLDFGIAKMLGVGEATQTAERFFTPTNAAPEQLRGEPVTVACDIYGLGTLLYELLSGRPPFDFSGCTAGEIERRICTVPPASMTSQASDDQGAQSRGLTAPAELRRRLSGDLDQIVQRCLRKAPPERYASVEQLDADLEAVLGDRPIAARTSEGWYRLRKFVARHRAASLLSTVLLLTLAIAGALLVQERNRAVRERNLAQSAIEVLKEAFLAADPGNSSEGTVTAAQILQAARETLAPRMKDEPALFAELAGTLAEVELGLGLDQRAEDLATEALQAAEIAGLEASVRHDLLVVAGSAQLRKGDNEAATLSLQRASEVLPEPTVERLIAMAKLHANFGRYDEALRHAQAAVSATGDREPSDNLALKARLQLVDAQSAADDAAGALETLQATLAWQKTHAADDPRQLLTRVRLVNLLGTNGQLEAAAREGEAVVAEVSAHYGPRALLTATARSNYAIVLYEQKRMVEAEQQFREVLAIHREVLGPTHGRTARGTLNLAQLIRSDPKRSDEAESLLRIALNAGQIRFGHDSNWVVLARVSLARLLNELERPAEALDLLVAEEALIGLKIAVAGNRDDFMATLAVAVEKLCGEAGQRAAHEVNCAKARKLVNSEQP